MPGSLKEKGLSDNRQLRSTPVHFGHFFWGTYYSLKPHRWRRQVIRIRGGRVIGRVLAFKFRERGALMNAIGIAVYWVLRAFLWPANLLLVGLSPAQGRSIAIEAGEKGWNLIEFEELLRSAEEFYPGRVSQVVIPTDSSAISYLRAVVDAVRTDEIGHYHYDPRSVPSKSVLVAFMVSLSLGAVFTALNVIPICKLTDYGMRRHRWQCALVSAFRGVVLSLQTPKSFGKSFPHRRIFGPFPMAISHATAKEQIDRSATWAQKTDGASFVGRLNEPRHSALKAIKNRLESDGIAVDILGQSPDIRVRRRLSADDYWNQLGRARLGLATTTVSEGPHIDTPPAAHLVYRIFETPLTGSLLLAQRAPGFSRFFIDGRDSLWFDSEEQLAQKLDPGKSGHLPFEEMAVNGQRRVRSLAQINAYWLLVETVLRRHSAT